MSAGGYLLVFASGQDDRDPPQPLHTNFALATDGEYLGLIAPDGERWCMSLRRSSAAAEGHFVRRRSGVER